MSDTSRIRDKFERFMETVRAENQKGIKYEAAKEEPKIIGYFTYDFDKKTEIYTPLNKE
jgi:hypothetical protein